MRCRPSEQEVSDVMRSIIAPISLLLTRYARQIRLWLTELVPLVMKRGSRSFRGMSIQCLILTSTLTSVVA